MKIQVVVVLAGAAVVIAVALVALGDIALKLLRAGGVM